MKQGQLGRERPFPRQLFSPHTICVNRMVVPLNQGRKKHVLPATQFAKLKL